MSRENVEVVEAIYGEWANRRLGKVFMAPDVRYMNPPDALEPGTRRGAESFNKIFGVYSEIRFEIDRLIDGAQARRASQSPRYSVDSGTLAVDSAPSAFRQMTRASM